MASRTGKRAPVLPRLISRLRAHHGPQPGPRVRDPYRLLLLEQVGYLASDATRLAAFRSLEERVGTEPNSILAAPASVLESVVRQGGAIAVKQRAERLRKIAHRVKTVWGGDLGPVLQLPFEDARRELARYPAIGEAGAERILLLTGAFPVLSLESNALRVLQRLGYGEPDKSWPVACRSAQRAAERELAETVPDRKEAFLLLRYHGMTVCRRSSPHCQDCPLLADCPWGKARTGKNRGET